MFEDTEVETEEVIIPKRKKEVRGLTPEIAQKWANALRSGKYSQDTGALQTPSGFCCLGVACDVMIREGRKRLDQYKQLAGGMPDNQHNAPKWLKFVNEDIGKRLGISLADLNDGTTKDKDTGVRLTNFDFNEIADIIELVYVHKALD